MSLLLAWDVRFFVISDEGERGIHYNISPVFLGKTRLTTAQLILQRRFLPEPQSSPSRIIVVSIDWISSFQPLRLQ